MLSETDLASPHAGSSAGRPHLRQRWVHWRRSRDVAAAVGRLVSPPRACFARHGRSLIMAPARVENARYIEVGEGVIVHEHAWFSVVPHFLPEVTPRLVLEDHVRIGRGCQLSVVGEVVIEARAIIGDFVQIGDTYHPYEAEDRMAALTPPSPVRVGSGAVLGSHVIVLPGVTIGAGAYVEHHAVVGHDVPAGGVVAGYPARPARAVPEIDDRRTDP